MSMFKVVLEAETTKIEPDDASDYTKAAEEEVDDESEDNTEDESDEVDSEDTDENDSSNDDENANETEDIEVIDVDSEEGEESSDYTNGIEDEDETDSDSTETDTTTEDEDGENDTSSDENSKQDSRNNKIIMDDFIKLYFYIKTLTKKVNTISGNYMVNSVSMQVSENLVNLSKIVYGYITDEFDTSYANNLYNYNYFLEIIKINVDMLKKVNTFDAK